MRIHRRYLLKGLAALGAVLALPRSLLASRPDDAFEMDDPDDAIRDLFGQSPTQSDMIRIKIPDIAENGAVVPVTVSSELPDVESISLVVDNNPTPLAASFRLTPRSAPTVSVRIKMGESSRVQALVVSDGALYGASKTVKVTIGGCGG